MLGAGRGFYALAALGLAAIGAAPTATAADGQPAVDRALLAPIDAVVGAMNRSDDRAVAAVMTRDVVLTDEVAPYRWSGPKAERQWSHDDGLLVRQRGVTWSRITRGEPTFVHRKAARAYVVVPMTYDYMRGGQQQHETGLWTIVMLKTRATWRIALLVFAKTGDTNDATWDG